MNKGKKFYLILGTIVLNAVTFALSTTFITLSWFNKGFDIEFNKQTGQSEANYFASGDGTKGNPYTITTPRHYYNFAWLQYLGEFNKTIKKDDIDIIDQKYFVLANDIDMSEYVVPPVGTSEYAFVGNFNGGGKVINNLKVSNNFIDFGARHPSVVNETSFNEKNINILGTFGVVGNDEVNRENRRKYYYNNENAINTPINCIQNLYLDNVTIISASNQLLIGIIAGYADGVIKTCGVHYATFEINGATSHYFDNGVLSKNEKISNYTLLGAYNTSRFSWNDGPVEGQKPSPTWGDSISMLNLYRRISYMAAGEKSITRYDYKNKLTNYNLTIRYETSLIPNYNRKIDAATYVQIYNDSYLPLSINTKTAFTKEIKNGNNYTTEFYIYTDPQKEEILDSNSGYIVGGLGGTANRNPGVVMRLQPLKDGLRNSYDSYTDVYDAPNLKMYTIDTTGESQQSILIDESYAKKMNKFDEVKKLFDENMKGMINITGFHFLNCFDTNKKTTVSDKTIKINGNQYDSYEFVDSSLNFRVDNPGYITTINGTFYSESDQTLFDLYYVERTNTSGSPLTSKINKIRKIAKVEKDANDGVKYTFSDNSTLSYSNFNSETSKIAFDFTKVSSSKKAAMSSMKAYYYEIPVMPGDYAIGKDSGEGNDNAYIMYLDIGADSQKINKKREPLEYIDFVSKKDNRIQRMSDKDYVKSRTGFYINDMSETEDTVLFRFKRKNDVIYYYSAKFDLINLAYTPSIAVQQIFKEEDFTTI